MKAQMNFSSSVFRVVIFTVKLKSIYNQEMLVIVKR